MALSTASPTGLFMDETAFEAGVVELDFVFTVGSTGAITAVKTQGATVVRTSAGLYTFTLLNRYKRSLCIIPRITGAAPTVTDGFDGYVTTDSVASTSAPLFAITFYPKGTSVTATDPASGDDDDGDVPLQDGARLMDLASKIKGKLSHIFGNEEHNEPDAEEAEETVGEEEAEVEGDVRNMGGDVPHAQENPCGLRPRQGAFEAPQGREPCRESSMPSRAS